MAVVAKTTINGAFDELSVDDVMSSGQKDCIVETCLPAPFLRRVLCPVCFVKIEGSVQRRGSDLADLASILWT